jgi:long-chain acyl-CoA synthetase
MSTAKKTICDILIERVKKTPSANAVGSIENNKINFLSFKKYKDNIECISIALVNLGLKTQTKVCILSHTRKEWNFIDLAIMCSGGVTVPVYPSYTPEEVEYIINHSEADFLIVENQDQLDKILEVQDQLKSITKIISIDQIKKESIKKIKKGIQFISFEECMSIGINENLNHPDQFLLNIENINPKSLATIVYTSGTTGQPKGAMINHDALLQVLQNVKKYTHNSIHGQDRFLTYLPLSHVLGRLESFFPILFGSETVYAKDMKNLINDIPVVQPTILVAVPRVLEKIYEKAMKSLDSNEIKKVAFKWATDTANNYFETIHNDKTPKSVSIIQYQLAKKIVFDKIYEMFGGKIRYFISGGAPLSTKIIEFMRNANLTVLEGYGLTETVAPCFINPMNFQIPGTVGQPMGDVEVKFLSDGEILLKSVAMFSGYYKNEEATKEVLDEDGWFHTGEIGEFNNKGFLKITDRKKDIIITSGGKNVAPQKIENILKISPYIAQVVIVGDKQKYLTALIGIESEAFEKHLEDFELQDHCDHVELANHPLVNQIVKNEIENINQELASFESIKKFKIIPCEMTTDNYLTPSLKTKKKLVIKDYALMIEAMYKN